MTEESFKYKDELGEVLYSNFSKILTYVTSVYSVSFPSEDDLYGECIYNLSMMIGELLSHISDDNQKEALNKVFATISNQQDVLGSSKAGIADLRTMKPLGSC